MFPHTITVYRHQDDDSYSRSVIRGVYWHGSRSQAKSDKGVDQDAAVTAVSYTHLQDGYSPISLQLLEMYPHPDRLKNKQPETCLLYTSLPHYERVKSTRIRWKSDFHLPRPEVELNFSIELGQKNQI